MIFPQRGIGLNSPSELKIDLNNQSNPIYPLKGRILYPITIKHFDIPVEYNAKVDKWIRFFLGNGRDYFVIYSERAGKFVPLLSKILELHDLPQDLVFVAMAESGFSQQAKSKADAVGPWQFMKSTAHNFGLKVNDYVDERKDPIKSTIAASRYLKKLFQMFGSWDLAMAAYNAGEGSLARALKKANTSEFWSMSEKNFLPQETKDYIPKIYALAIMGKNLEHFGIDSLNFHEPLNFEEVDIPGNTNLHEYAKKIGTDWKNLQQLNPELLQPLTPPNVKNYKLRIDQLQMANWRACCSK